MVLFETPILFLVFNRLDTTKKVFAKIKKIKPKILFIAADGPRNPKEKKVTDSVRKYILSNINWNCKVETLFRDENLGCGQAVSGAIDWFFENVELGIILEDDCLPDQSFFPFCEETLKKYKTNEEIMHIAGFNPVDGDLKIKSAYLFSKYGSIWGWATWKRAWEKYSFTLKANNVVKDKIIKSNLIDSLSELLWRIRVYELTFNGKIDTWDYQWSFSRFVNGGLSIIPKVNLIENIGFSSGATHTTNSNWTYGVKKIKFPLSHPKKIFRNKKFDNLFYSKFINGLSIKGLFFNIKFLLDFRNWWLV
jgi:hypothetical protein